MYVFTKVILVCKNLTGYFWVLFCLFLQYLCFCLVLVLSTYTWSSRGKGFSIAWGRGPQWTSLHTALSAPVRGQGSDAMMVLLSKTNFIRKLLNELCRVHLSTMLTTKNSSHTLTNCGLIKFIFPSFNKNHHISNITTNLDTLQL